MLFIFRFSLQQSFQDIVSLKKECKNLNNRLKEREKGEEREHVPGRRIFVIIVYWIFIRDLFLSVRCLQGIGEKKKKKREERKIQKRNAQ